MRRRAIRLNCLERHRPVNFPRRRWRNILFSDESRFSLHCADGRKPLYRWKGESYADTFAIEHDRFGGGSVMVLRSIAYNFKSPLIVINGTMNAVNWMECCSYCTTACVNVSARQRTTPCCSDLHRLSGSEQYSHHGLASL